MLQEEIMLKHFGVGEEVCIQHLSPQIVGAVSQLIHICFSGSKPSAEASWISFATCLCFAVSDDTWANFDSYGMIAYQRQ